MKLPNLFMDSGEALLQEMAWIKILIRTSFDSHSGRKVARKAAICMANGTHESTAILYATYSVTLFMSSALYEMYSINLYGERADECLRM